ncbi:sulfite exporter TauE/SafE family protein [Rhodohalobacter sp.]|uniref:sulfite exporter TauE/SafE family protein n=1 Tax=Rhodohalobacter sp. TaxID=1974210 RepID=UPI002ACEA8D4|nr:sulfite exporter TauE/SafE family protein [Rhodohalobacter sp.]MDZ7758300.1 sulfite exporter TauE/SafE family protein [Rhodohalobacter sp.]
MLYTIVFFIIAIASFVFAMLGLGGGMVYVPVLNWAGFDMVKVAIPLGLLLNGLNTALVLIPFARKKMVDWKGGAVMAVTALIAAPLGAMTSEYVPVQTLKILFAAMVLAAALRTLWASRLPEPQKMMSLKKRSIIGFFVGSFAGFTGGMLGLGGGFIVAPILMMMGYKTKEAAATTAMVVTFSSASGYLGHTASGEMNWELTVIVVIAVIIGSQLGGRYMTQKAKSKHVKVAYAVVLLLIAFKMIYEVIA